MRGNSIKAGAAISYVSIGLNILISLVYTPWMINQLGRSEYGLYTLILTFISYFLLDFGIGSAISRFVSNYKERKELDKLKQLYGVITTVYIILDIIILIIIFIAYFFLEDLFGKLTPDEIATFKNVYVIAALFSICTFTLKPLDGIMMAYEFFVPLKMLDMLQRIGTVIFIAVVLVCGGKVYSLIFANGIIALIVAVSKLIYLCRKKVINISLIRFDKSIARSIFGFSLWIFLINIAQRFRLNLVPAVLGSESGTSEITIFSIAMALEGFVWTFANALNGLFIPKVTRMVQSHENREGITSLMIKVGRFQLIVIGFIIVGFIGLGRSFIKLWLGDGYDDTYYIAVCLILPNIITMTEQIGTTLSYVENEVKYNSIISFTSSLISFILCLFVAKEYGALGCGYAVLIALILSAIAINLFYNKVLKLSIGRFFKSCHMKIVPTQFLILVLILGIGDLFIIKNWLHLIIAAIIYSLVYCFVCYKWMLKYNERHMIKSVLLKQKL